MTKPFELSFQCDVPWDSMRQIGPGRRRCGECNNEVLDLSAHARKEADEILRRSPNLCVSFVIGLGGAPIYRRPPSKRSLAVLASGLLAACGGDEPAAELTSEPPAGVEVEESPCLLDDDLASLGGPLDPGEGEASVIAPVATQAPGAPSVEEDALDTTARVGDRNDTRRRRHHATGPGSVGTRTAGIPARRD